MKEIPPHVKEKIDKLTDELKKVYELAEESWEGCDGCDENDKYFFMKGFQAGYNRAKPDELSDDEKNDEYLLKCLTIFSNKLLESEQSKNNEISDEEIEKGAREYYEENIDNSNIPREHYEWEIKDLMVGFCAKWYREQLKNIDKKL